MMNISDTLLTSYWFISSLLHLLLSLDQWTTPTGQRVSHTHLLINILCPSGGVGSLRDKSADSGLADPVPGGGGRSRLEAEFEVLEVLGKGGFGDVIKVRTTYMYMYIIIVTVGLENLQKSYHKLMVFFHKNLLNF